MQKGVQKHFRKRALYYTTYPINEQGREARDLYLKEKAEGKANAEFRWDYNLKPVIVVAILNFRFEHEGYWPTDGYRSSYKIREDNHHELMTDALRFVFLELKRFNKRIDELETTADKWTYLLKHMHEMTEIPEEFSDPTFRRLFMLAEIGNFTPEEHKMYINSLKNMGDYTNIINTAAENAKHEGLIEGIAIGEARGLTKVAKQMLLMGMDTDTIVKATGLTLDQVEALRSGI
jgi:predicted transposase/invertase (TIGR01784 family)